LASLLAPDGKIGLQAITMPYDRMRATARTRTWITKYIFPGAMIRSMTAIRENAARFELRVTDALSFGAHYARTLALWRNRLGSIAAGRSHRCLRSSDSGIPLGDNSSTLACEGMNPAFDSAPRRPE